MSVTILLAAYQGARFLPAQLASLSAQREREFTVLYQDDGSRDGTEEMLREWAGKDPRFIPGAEQGRRLGAIGNFMSLLRQSQGDYIFFCDQDDIWEGEKVSALLEVCREAEKRRGRDFPLLVHSNARIIDEAGNETAPDFFRLQGWDPGAAGLNRLLVQNNVTGCLMMINRPLAELITAYGNPERMFMHDWFAALTAAAFGEILFVPRRLTGYRQHGNNAMGASRESLVRRGMKALGQREKAKERIHLTYTHTRAFLDAYGDALPREAREIAEAYLATEKMGKMQRVREVRRLGCLMQSPITRLGQTFFG